MDSGQDRLLQFDRDLLSGKNICSSEGIFVNFPPSLKKPFQMKGLGLIVCRQGNFQFSLNQNPHLHVFRLLQNLKLAVFGNKQTFACSCEMLFLIKRKLVRKKR